ncbi:MAG TPA: polysaccharide deacetylase family protein [Blastocatellia bacterium]|nr:polysaccharide deacetylase family protein [Blastocatellia bacterium]
MRIPRLIGAGSMAIASRFDLAGRGGVIINEHVLTAAETRRHVDALSRWFDFIHHDELLDRLARPKARPFCLLTFDDGKRSFATETAPELTRLGVPAVIYVATRFLTDRTPLWFDRRIAIERSLGYLPPEIKREVLIRLPLASINARLDRACDQYKVTVDMEDDDIRPMSWDEARNLARLGFTIGSHSLHHAVLTCEEEDSALSDIERSIAEVSSEIGTTCKSFAFPNGNYTDRLARRALEAGAQTVMTTDPMWADNSFPRWRLPRVSLSGAYNRGAIELKMALATGCWLLNPNGTGRLYRKRSQACETTGAKW